MIDKLIKLANHLDSKGFTKEADYLDSIISIASLDKFIHNLDYEFQFEYVQNFTVKDMLMGHPIGQEIYKRLEYDVKGMSKSEVMGSTDSTYDIIEDSAITMMVESTYFVNGTRKEGISDLKEN